MSDRTTTNDKPDLSMYDEIQLITELAERGIDIDFVIGAYMHLQESYYDLQDQIYGNSEDGLHGKGANR